MAPRKPLKLQEELLLEFEKSMFVSEYLVNVTPESVWHAKPIHARGRSIAGIVAHMHNLRRGFIKLADSELTPESLDRGTVSKVVAVSALAGSRAALMQLFSGAIERGDGRIKGLPRRVVDMMLYLTQHDAHHRGQITRQVRELGEDFSEDDVMRIWGWKKLDCSSY